MKTEERFLEIGEFVEGLKALPHFMTADVYGYLKTHPVQPGSLRPYMFFRPASYTRNLIFKNELFEVLTLCWEIGQASRIHNHRNQRCWMAVPAGKVAVQNYRVLDCEPEKKPAGWKPVRVT